MCFGIPALRRTATRNRHTEKHTMDICVILVLLTFTGQVQGESKDESFPSGSCNLSDLYGMATSCETDFICQSKHADCSARYEALLYCVTGIVWNCFRGTMTDDELVVKAAAVQMMFKTSRSQDFYCSGRIWTRLHVGRYLAENDGACTPAFYDEKDECFSPVYPSLNSGDFMDPHLCNNYEAALACTREAMRNNCRFPNETNVSHASLGHNPFCDCSDESITTATNDNQEILPTDVLKVLSTKNSYPTVMTVTYEPYLPEAAQDVHDIGIHFMKSAGQNMTALSKAFSIILLVITIFLAHIR